MTPLRFGRVAALFALAALIAGCARPVGSVSGTVTYNGKPLKAGSVVFVSTDGGQSHSAGLDENGAYSVAKITGGNYKVTVDTSYLAPQNTSGPAGMYGMKGMKGAPGPTGPPTIPKGAKSAPPAGADVPEGYAPSDPAAMANASKGKLYTKIPEKYKDEASTDLLFEAKGGDQTFNIDLK